MSGALHIILIENGEQCKVHVSGITHMYMYMFSQVLYMYVLCCNFMVDLHVHVCMYMQLSMLSIR